MREWINLIESLRPSKLIEDFTQGYCYALALELNRLFRWPIAVIADEDEDYTTVHAFNMLSDGRAFDINGPQQTNELLKNYAGDEDGWRIIEVTRLELLNLLNPELRKLTIRSKDYAQQAIVQYLKPTYPDVFPKKKPLGEDANLVTLYHGTCRDNAEALCSNGWTPRSGQAGGNAGQNRYLYLTTEIEDAEWFANEKGCSSIVSVSVPMDYLIVDPEDGVGDTVEDELNSTHGLPGKVALTRAIGPEAFKQIR